MKTTSFFLLFFTIFSLNTLAQPGHLITTVRDSYPSVSPDGKWIAFHSNRSGKQAIYIVDTAGKNIKQLTSLGWDEGTPKWSPDGAKIVFAAEPETDNSEIFSMNIDGSGIKRLTNTPGDDSHPGWSADGKKIIFNSARTTPDLKVSWGKQFIEIFEMNADGSRPRQITNFKTVSTYPCYSPDGKSVVFRMVTNETGLNWDFSPSVRNSEVFVCDINGGNPVNLSKNASFDGWPAWSPDGKYIAFASNRAGPANVGSTYIIKPDGTGLKRISTGPTGVVQPAWTSDSKWIYGYMNSEDENEYGFIQRMPSTVGN